MGLKIREVWDSYKRVEQIWQNMYGMNNIKFHGKEGLVADETRVMQQKVVFFLMDTYSDWIKNVIKKIPSTWL